MKNKLFNQLDAFPEFLNSHHLVQLGLYPSIDAVCLARLRGNSPDFVKLKGKVLYPKINVVEFLEVRMKKGSVTISAVNEVVESKE